MLSIDNRPKPFSPGGIEASSLIPKQAKKTAAKAAAKEDVGSRSHAINVIGNAADGNDCAAREKHMLPINTLSPDATMPVLGRYTILQAKCILPTVAVVTVRCTQ